MSYGEWTPVSEGHPDYNVKVLCCLSRGGYCIAEYREYIGWYRFNHGDHYINPIAWTPLPEPYKE